MLDLTHLGFTPSQIHRNLSYEELYQHETRANEGFETNSGAYSVDTGRFTGRSPKDKFFVKIHYNEKKILLFFNAKNSFF